MSDGERATEDDPARIKFHYVKSNAHRVIYVDGAHGGLTPSKLVHMTVYCDRAPIPKVMSFKLNPDRSLGEEVREEREAREGIIREVEATLLMDRSTAVAFRDWLQARIAQIDAIDSRAGETT